MIQPELLAILACPESRQPLTLADDGLLARINGKVAAGGLANVGGADVTEPLAAALVREDGQVVYPVRDDIPVLLVDEGIRVEAEPADAARDSATDSGGAAGAAGE